MFVGGEFSKVGQLTRFPEPMNGVTMPGDRQNMFVSGETTEREIVARRSRLHETFRWWGLLETRKQRVQRTKIQHRVAPLQNPHRVVTMAFDACDQFISERFGFCRDPEGTVIHVASGAPGDLAKLFGAQGTHAKSVELFQAGERDMIDVHIDA